MAFTDTERRKAILNTYAEAARELRRRHIDEYWEILQQLQEERGITVRPRRTKDERRRADIAQGQQE